MQEGKIDMIEINRRSGAALRIGAMACLAALSLAASAQRPPIRFKSNDDEIKPVLQFRTAPAVRDTTFRFFPQVVDAVRQKSVKPSHQPTELVVGKIIDRGIPSGKIGGDTFNDTMSLFPGIGFTGSLPPDPDIAVGPDHIVQVVNGAVAFFTKDGTKVFQQPDTPTAFWSGIGAGNFIFDPKCFYDHISQRFYIVELDVDFGAETSHMLIAVSDDDDPNGSWLKYKIDTKLSPGGTASWMDYPGFGFSKDGVIVTGNLFGFSSGYTKTEVLAMNKAELLSGGAVNVTVFEATEFSIQPSRSIDSADAVYGASRPNGGGSNLTLFAFDDFTTTPTMQKTVVAVPVFTYGGYNAPAGGGSHNTLPYRLMSSCSGDGHFYTAHTTGADLVTDGRTQVTWYDFDMGNWPASGSPTLVQAGDVKMPGDIWAYQPGIGVNSLNDVSISFTASSSSEKAAAMATSRKVTDAPGQMSTPTVLDVSPGVSVSGSRWGDYSDVEVDPADGTTFWGVNELMQGGFAWQTTINSWEVSKPTGGANLLRPIAMEVLLGTLLGGGGTAEASEVDETYYDVRSVKSGRSGQLSILTATFNTEMLGEDVRKIHAEFTATTAFGRRVSASLFAWNYDTEEWEYQRNYKLRSGRTSLQEYDMEGDVDPFVSDEGNIKLLLRSHEPLSRWFGGPRTHILRIDQVVILPS
jgi:hypothetical protein